MKAKQKVIFNEKGKKLIKLYGQSINAYIIVNEEINIEAYTTFMEATNKFIEETTKEK